MEVTAIAKTIFQENKDVLTTWFSVLTRGPKSFHAAHLDRNSTLLYGLRFMFYMIVIELVLTIPFAKGMESKSENVFVIGGALAEDLVEYLAAALILHGAMKAFGGKGRAQGCVASYCFFTAYVPIIAIFMLPWNRLSTPLMAKSANYPQIVAQLSGTLSQLATWDRYTLVLSFLAATVVWILFYTGVFRCFRALHKLSRTRAVFAFVVGLLLTAAFNAVFTIPLLTGLYQTSAGN
ncbi:MAG TPA: hypothetical protein VGR47_06225 [Terracidiphilus sp.]|nr:hypothetical protein [Terracidiphilus sp.]